MSARGVPNCSAIWVSVRVHSQYVSEPCPASLIQHMRVTSMALIAALSFSPVVLFMTLGCGSGLRGCTLYVRLPVCCCWL